ncbi:unnamed protein product, partial [Brenthis ino]
MYRVIFSFMLIHFLVSGQSPCPDNFEYFKNDRGVYGLITIQPFGKVSTVYLEAKFTIGARVPPNYALGIEPIGSELNLLDNFNRGVPLKYQVSFPSTSPIPKLVELTINNNVFCRGAGDSISRFNTVTTINLQHTLYYKVQPNGFSNVIQPRPQSPALPAHDILDDYNAYLIKDGSVYNIVKDKPTWQDNRDDTDIIPENIPYVPIISNEQPNWQGNKVYPVPSTEYPVTVPRRKVNVPETTTQIATKPPKPKPAPRPIQSGSSNSIECGINSSNEPVALVYKGYSYERGEWPWLVALYKSQFSSLSYICAGTLISDRHVVSAAHCIRRKTELKLSNIVIKAGVYNLDDWTDISVSKVLGAAIHEGYNTSTLENDILVLTLDRTVPFGEFIRPACLWSGDTDLSRIVGTSGVVAGWGASEFGTGGMGEPLMVRMPIVSTTTCRASKAEFHRITSSNTLCAGDRNGSGPCLGDSGGGLYILDNGRWRLRGVVSKSLPSDDPEYSCNLNEYIVFTDTAQYLPWIKDIMSKTAL